MHWVNSTNVKQLEKIFHLSKSITMQQILIMKICWWWKKVLGLFQDFSSIFHFSGTVFQDCFGFQNFPGPVATIFNDFINMYYSIFSIVHFYFHGFLKVKKEQKQTWENVWDIFAKILLRTAAWWLQNR